MILNDKLLVFDVLAVTYISILYLTLGVRVKDSDTVFVSGFNMVIMRVWISACTNVFTFGYGNFFQGFLELIICYVIEDIYGYVIHRYMHYNKKIYRLIHSQHHKNQAECFTTAFYVHPAELVAFYFIGLIIGPFCISFFWNISVIGYNMWLLGSTFFLIWSHTGLNVNYMPDTKFHYLHHKFYTCNYGTAFSDWLFGTARWDDSPEYSKISVSE